MPAADTILLPLCAALALFGVIYTGFQWRAGNRGRVLQGAALALAPIALYLTGLLRLLWDAVVAILDWITAIAFVPSMWVGLTLLGVCIVLFIVGGVLGARSAAKTTAARTAQSAPGEATPGKKTAGKSTAGKPALPATRSTPGAVGKPKPAGKPGADPIDDDMAEIEALLKARGIE